MRDSANFIIFNPGNCDSSSKASHVVGVPILRKISEIPCYYLGSRWGWKIQSISLCDWPGWVNQGQETSFVLEG